MLRRIACVLLALAGLSCESGPVPMDGGFDAGFDAGTDPSRDAGPLCVAATALPSPLVCNGHEELCDRTFDAVSFPATHNAMSSAEEGWLAPNQGYRLWRQLEDGVRGFMLDTYREGGETLLCHSMCALGSRPFVDALVDLRTFMECHPAEVITLILEAHIDEETTRAAFEAAGLLELLHAQPIDAPWPTLREMIESGRRMVVFTESSTTSLPWYHYAYRYGWDNPYSNRTPDDLSCAPNRGDGGNAIFILNHFLTAPIAMRSLADMVNYNPFFLEQVQRCQTEAAQLPNFITVDFYESGDLFEVVNTLNGF